VLILNSVPCLLELRADVVQGRPGPQPVKLISGHSVLCGYLKGLPGAFGNPQVDGGGRTAVEETLQANSLNGVS